MIRAAAVVLALVLAPSAEAAGIYFGSLHGHTRYSDGAGTPKEVFAWARQYFDFYAVTDHGELLTSAEWKDIGTQASRAYVKNQFVTLRGFEYSNPFQGHACVWNTSSYTSYFAQPLLEGFYGWLDGRGAYYASFNHPGDPAGAFRFFRYSANVADNFVAIETGNGGDSNAAGDYYGWYLTALGSGWKIAPVFGQDNHALGTPSPGRTAVHAESLTREGILQALSLRRVYSTDDPDLKIWFSATDGDGDGGPMGSTLTAGSVSFQVTVTDPTDPITSIELVKNGGAIPVAFSGVNTVELSQALEVAPGDWVLLRVETLAGGEGWGTNKVAFTAPIWFE